MNEDLNQFTGSRSADDVKSILMTSLLGTTGVMWVVGGILAVFSLYDAHWILGLIGAFVWVWGCWAAALYFDVKRFLG